MDQTKWCFVCQLQLSENDDVVTVSEGSRQLTIHRDCLAVFRKLLKVALEPETSPLASIARGTSIVEILREKKPKTEDEKLACVAYFIEQQAKQRLELTTKDIRDHLRSANIKIRDLATAFIRARDRRGFFERVPDTKPIRHRLTATGATFVEQLPEEA